MGDAYNLRKNIVFASEELARTSRSVQGRAAASSDIIRSIFGTTYKDSLDPGNSLFGIVGNALSPRLSTNLSQTGLYSQGLDNGYHPARFENYGSSPMLSSLQAFYYKEPVEALSSDKTFGLVSFSPHQHCIYLGADWRNFADISFIMESILSGIGGLISDEAALPVELISFDASVSNGAVLLSWLTSSEVRSSEYTIEKLVGGEFVPIYSTAALGSLQLTNSYSALDAAVSLGNTYTYRLRTLDLEGGISYSSERSVSLAAGSGFAVLESVLPNPVSSDVTLNFSLSVGSLVRLSVYDLSGREVLVLASEQIGSGKHSRTFSLNRLSSGSYSIVMKVEGKECLKSIVKI